MRSESHTAHSNFLEALEAGLPRDAVRGRSGVEGEAMGVVFLPQTQLPCLAFLDFFVDPLLFSNQAKQYINLLAGVLIPA